MCASKKLQIILITYNRAKPVEKTLEQFFAESSPVKDCDFLVLSNNSTDNTKNIVEKWQEKIPIGKLNTFEVGTGNKTSIKELVLIIQKEMNKQEITLNFGAIPYRKNEVLDYELNLSGLHLLGYKPEYLSIQKGIHKLLEEQGLCNE